MWKRYRGVKVPGCQGKRREQRMKIRSYRDLMVWQQGKELAKRL